MKGRVIVQVQIMVMIRDEQGFQQGLRLEENFSIAQLSFAGVAALMSRFHELMEEIKRQHKEHFAKSGN